ncbi:MAG TPA: methyltransferase domain-containing protein [Acidimicrobiales bacterium]|nr:methyltransferase domain-containing protein [Acidimicrobiales bacterium]
MFRCPVCKHPLARGDAAWRCETGHSYDVAREGYVNLLITHQRRRREPGDSAEMLAHRRAFLDAGHYRPLKDALADLVPAGASVLDVGCGEGYYTRDLPNPVWGIDIAKAAVRLAAKRTERSDAHYAVASAYDLPVLDGAADVVVSVFAPLHSVEFERVLTPGGMVVTVVPGPRHLDGLKARFFEAPELHPDEGPFEREGATTALRPTGRHEVTYDLELTDGGTIDDLVHMTPYAWYVSPERRGAVVASAALRTTVDFRVFTYVVS